MKMRVAVLGFAALFLVSTQSAESNRPIDQVRATADRIIGILNDPALAGGEKRAERHQLLRQELENRFDWPTICRSCLGRHWSKLTRDQQKQFEALFKQFLERTYLDRIEPYYSQLDRIEYQGERILEKTYASVKTVVVTKQKLEHPVEYRLQKGPSGLWQVYDVTIEGVSLVKNYRDQFDQIMNRSAFAGLVEELNARIAEQKGTL